MFRDPDRPLLLSVVFWLDAVGVAAGYVLTPGPAETAMPFGVNMAVVVALWPFLAWTSGAPVARKAAGPVFLVATVTLGFNGVSQAHLPMTLVALACLGLVYGVRVSAAIIGALLVAGFAVMLLITGRGWEFAAAQSLFLAVGATFVLGLASATLEARRRRAESERLLARVRELTVAEERARMARDMHDSLGHRLTVIKMGLENAERRPEDVWAEVAQAKRQSADALAEARRWVRALRPLPLNGSVGPAALETLARSFDGTGVSVRFAVDGAPRPLSPDTELVLYRVLQEGLTNALRHAAAGSVQARLSYADDRVRLVVADDGRGAQAPPGFGLTSLAERARELGGRLHAGDADDGGFELRTELPVAAA